MKKAVYKNAYLIAVSAVGLAYLVAMVISASIADNDIPEYVHYYVLGGTSSVVAAVLMYYTIKTGKRGLALYMALGISCLAIGRLFVIAADIVSYWTDTISIGLIAQVCCYLFIMASCSLLLKINRVLWAILNALAFIATAACAVAVVLNSGLILNLSVIALNLICGGLALTLLIKYPGKRLFGAIILSMCTASILSSFSALYIYPTLISPLLSGLLIIATIRLDKEVKDA